MTMHARFYQSEAIDSVHPIGGRKLIVVPTGGGKSYILGRIGSDNAPIMGRVLVFVHVQELVEQNTNAFTRIDPTLDLGLVCASLKRAELPAHLRDFLGKTDAEITVASIQSVYKKLHLWDDVGLIIIDEAHRITPLGGKLFTAVLKRFPDVPVIGLTATPFRMGTGYLHKGEHKLFDEISYEITYPELVELGYLVPFASKGSELAYEDTGLKKVGGEFSQKDLDLLTVDGAKTQRIVKQMVQRASGRKHKLVFAINKRHALMIKGFLEEEGQSCGALYDDMAKDGLRREDEIEMFRLGVYDYLINVNILTTGFDFPALDCIILLRPIASPVLYIQCCGRGTRTSPETGKHDCLILDYGGNVGRHGEFGQPTIKEAKAGKKTKICASCGEKNTEAARYCASGCGYKFKDMFKTCPKCQAEVDRQAQSCSGCGYAWPVNESKLDEDGKTLIPNKAIWLSVASWTGKPYTPRLKDDGSQSPDSFLLTYKSVDGISIREYTFPESYPARPRFERFWLDHQMGGKRDNTPKTASQAYDQFRTLHMPKEIKVIRQGVYYNVLSRKF